MVRCYCHSVIIVIAVSANSRENWKWGPCYLSSGARPLVWQRNTLHWPIAYSPKHGWGTCTILGNLFHSSFAIDPSMQREPGARGSTIAAQLNCGALCCRGFPLCVCVCVALVVEGTHWCFAKYKKKDVGLAHDSSYSCVDILTLLILRSHSSNPIRPFYPIPYNCYTSLKQQAAYLSVFGPMSRTGFTMYRVCLDNIPKISRGSSHSCAS